MHSEYVERYNGGFYVTGTRVSLDSVVYAFNRGDSPERILERFPLLDKASKVYGAIAYYLDHRPEIDAYLESGERELETVQGRPLAETDPVLWERLQRARTRTGAADPADPRT